MQTKDNNRNHKIAILIDADNISAKYFETIINKANEHGRITAIRVYGDWSKTQLKPWREPANKYSLTYVQQYSNLSNKPNASDFTLVIDAMDLLYSRKNDAFCIVSSDSDFTKLVIRLKEDDVYLFGMGEEKTPEVLVNSYERFYYLDKLYEELNPKKTPKENLVNATVVKPKGNNSQIQKLSTIVKTLKQIIGDNAEDDGWAHWSLVADLLRKRYPGFDPVNYGQKLKALNFFKGISQFEIKTEGTVTYIKVK